MPASRQREGRLGRRGTDGPDQSDEGVGQLVVWPQRLPPTSMDSVTIGRPVDGLISQRSIWWLLVCGKRLPRATNLVYS